MAMPEFDLVIRRLKEEALGKRAECPPLNLIELLVLDTAGFPRDNWTASAMHAHFAMCRDKDCLQFFSMITDLASEDGHPTQGLIAKAIDRRVSQIIEDIAAHPCPECGGLHAITVKVTTTQELGRAALLHYTCGFKKAVPLIVRR